jgi:hypothetical protein
MSLSVSRLERVFSILLFAAAGAMAAGQAQAACNIVTAIELPVNLDGNKPTVQATLNGQPVALVVDSASPRSELAPASAKALGLDREPTPAATMKAIGGSVFPDMTTVKAFGLGDQTLDNWRFVLVPMPGSATGVLGQDLLGAFDVEYDFKHGAIRLMKPEGCGDESLAYWAKDRPVSVMPLDWPQGRDRRVTHTAGAGVLNGTKVKVGFSSASNPTLVDTRAAEHAGVKMDGPDVRVAGEVQGHGVRPVKVKVARFKSFKLGDEEVQNPQFRVGDLGIGRDMVVGADFFVSHRIYVANSQHRIYITYEGGPVFGAPAQELTAEEASEASGPVPANGP